ncbi:MAG: hypothetical protein M4579_007280 [Chaenotheca gracillima]|nr:MAG: hypothetical protein M4579_007280 [Chaenotheca gracillima]
MSETGKPDATAASQTLDCPILPLRLSKIIIWQRFWNLTNELTNRIGWLAMSDVVSIIYSCPAEFAMTYANDMEHRCVNQEDAMAAIIHKKGLRLADSLCPYLWNQSWASQDGFKIANDKHIVALLTSVAQSFVSVYPKADLASPLRIATFLSLQGAVGSEPRLRLESIDNLEVILQNHSWCVQRQQCAYIVSHSSPTGPSRQDACELSTICGNRY